ncbi:MAG: hypothetical protein GY874_18560 [Desulfobacteraceae bacterium]|nr:hypothetical protein [Desulfobacteraceae bacterium]
MKLRFKCTNHQCCGENKIEQQLDLPLELVMDENNIAVIFCPKCKQKLKQIN